MLLKVMAGDKFHIHASAWWTGTGSGSNTSPLTSIVSALIGSAPGISGGKIGSADLTSTILDPQITAFLSDQPAVSGKPKAYLNWILFDEQFKYVADGSGAEAVDASGVFKPFNKTDMPVNKNGYLYIYVSNETAYDVFFDNLQVTHVRGSMLEESHYYPFGLTMAGISSKALEFGGPDNKEQTFQGQRLDDELDLNWVQFKWRNHDPQIGRFVELDPLAEKYAYNSPYTFSENKVTNDIELEGLEAISLTKPSTWLTQGNMNAANELIINAVTSWVMPVEGESGGTRSAIRSEVKTTIKADISAAIKAAIKADVKTAVKNDVTTLEKNVAQGAAFEQKVVSDLAKQGGNVAEQVTIKAENGVKTRIDAVSTNSDGQIVLTEAKSSATAPLTNNQKAAFPSIALNGGVIVGKGKPGYPGGTVIPPTQVNIVRPAAIDNTYVKSPIVLQP